MAKRKGDFTTPVSKKKYSSKYKPEWTTDMPWLGPSDRGASFAYCRVCSSHISIASGGRNDAVRHGASATHSQVQAVVSSTSQPHMRSFFVSSKATELITKVIGAEVRFAQFVAEHNLPFSVADHFTKLAKEMFSDSDIAGKFACGRMKTTMIVKKSLAPSVDAHVVELCRNGKFSLLIDESNDQGGEKTLVILVRVFDSAIGKAVTRFVDIPICNIGTSASIFDAVNKCFRYITLFYHAY